MRQFMRTLTIAGCCLLSLFILPHVSHSAVLNVPSPYPTIQSALAAAYPGDVIVVAAGTYVEDNLAVNKGVILQGAGVGLSIIDASASAATGAVINITAPSGNVLVSGFTIKTSATLDGVYEKAMTSGTITVSHNRIEGHAPNPAGDNYGLIAGYGSLASLVFTYNEVTNCGDNPILLEQHVGPTDVSYNFLDRTSEEEAGDAYFNMNHDAANITSLQRVSHNVIDMGAGTVFTNDTRGAGITFASAYTGTNGGFTNIEITDNVIYNLKPYRRGIGLWNNAPGDGSAGNITGVVIARNTILANAGATASYAVRVLGLVTGASITDNFCDQLDYAIWVRAWNGHIATGTVANRNSFARCTSYGIYSEAVSPNVDGTNNWWGDATGPAPGGSGCAVSSYVDYTPWITDPNMVSVVPVFTLSKCGEKRTVTFHIAQSAATAVRGYEVKFDLDPAVAAVASLADIKEGNYLKSVGGTTFYAMGGGGGGGRVSYIVSCAILGGKAGAMGAGDLFTADLTTVAQGTSTIQITSVKLRDPDNVPLPAAMTGGSIQVDCTSPTMEPIAEAQGGWYNHAPTFANFGFDDDLNLDHAEYKIDGGGWNSLFAGINAASWDSDGWALPGFAGLSQGSHTIYFRVTDDAGNVNGEGGSEPNLYSWQFNKDTVPPEPPTGFVAMPGHNKTHLTWSNPTGDPTFAGVEIRMAPWSGYPHYLPPAPSYPGDHTQGTFVATVVGAAYDDNPRAPRDIYYYSAFSKDLAGNYSTLGTSAKGRATSYWLGDITADGRVDVNDLVPFSATFGLLESHPSFNALCDFGPTYDYSRFGIPLPDNRIDFEDLMIFAMNWDQVTPAGLGDLIAARVSEDLGDLVKVELLPGSDGMISVVLKNHATTLKGIHLVVAVDGEVSQIAAGTLLAGRSDVFFGTLPGGVSKADICIAALGADTPLLPKTTGEIARVQLKASDAPVSVRVESVDLRNLDNRKTGVASGDQYEAPFVPKATALMQNYPNPFNPTTTLTFDVVEAGVVTIQVYDVSGRLVATLFNARAEAGRHRVTWNGTLSSGSPAPSGIYFCRMKAAGYETTKKMILVR
jgi:hypothetical protein